MSRPSAQLLSRHPILTHALGNKSKTNVRLNEELRRSQEQLRKLKESVRRLRSKVKASRAQKMAASAEDEEMQLAPSEQPTLPLAASSPDDKTAAL